ncbi:MAG: hypothetical protein HYX90_01765 [Chloroflexi bacterium]|nr:hypothetical protein [Chloroflexota bacterium]
MVKKYAGNPLLSPPVAWVKYYLEHPVVLKEGNEYHMYFHGIGEEGGQYKIGHATAPKPWGPWSVDPKPVLDVTPGQWDGVYVATPYVMKIGNVFYMWYSGYNGTTISIGLATSDAPGGPFVKRSGNPFARPTEPPPRVEGWVGSVQKVENKFHMWFGAEVRLNYGEADKPEGPWKRTEMGQELNKGDILKGLPNSWNDAASMGEAGVVYRGGLYYMFMGGHSVEDAVASKSLFTKEAPGPDPKSPFQIGLLVSMDGWNWYHSPHNPIIRRGEPGSYDSFRLSEIGAYYEDDVFYVYYTSIRPSNKLPMGDETISVSTVRFR